MFNMLFTRLVIFFLLCQHHQTAKKTRPNIVLILTDDQDLVLGGDEPLLQTRRLVKEAGVDFSQAYVTTSICCPSRASILTGRYPHNTGVTNNTVEGGCSDKTWREGVEKKTFATHLKGVGYTTMYAGKYLNQYGKKKGGGVGHIPQGWDWWAGLVGNSKYYNYTLSINGKRRHHGDNYTLDYLTDVIRDRAVEFLDKQNSETPFLMVLAPPACHAPFTPAPQYMEKYKNKQAPRNPAFNRHQADDTKKHWLIETEPRQMSNQSIEMVDEIFRNRWRTLLSVDDLVSSVYSVLDTKDLLSNTVVLYTSDHGYHLGQFGMPVDKRLPYEFDIRVPFWISGPGISSNQTVSTPVLSIDIAPTLLDIAGLPPSPVMDGLSFLSLIQSNNKTRANMSNLIKTNEITENQLEAVQSIEEDYTPDITTNFTGIQGRHSFLVEYWGEGSKSTSSPSCNSQLYGDLSNLAECDKRFQCKCQDSRNNTYFCVRTHGQEDSIFCQFQDVDTFQEMYNIKQDPFQLTNIAHLLQNDTLQYYLKVLGLLKNCKGTECNNL